LSLTSLKEKYRIGYSFWDTYPKCRRAWIWGRKKVIYWIFFPRSKNRKGNLWKLRVYPKSYS